EETQRTRNYADSQRVARLVERQVVSRPRRTRRGLVMANGRHQDTRRKYIRPGSAEDGDKRLMALRRDLIDMANDGYFDNEPEMKSRILNGYNPLLELAVMSVTAPNESQRIVAAKIVSEFTYVPLVRHEESDPTGPQIVVQIAPWASAHPPKPALPAP